MDANYFPYIADGGYVYDQSLEFISEDFNDDEHRRSLSSSNTLASSELTRAQEAQSRKPPRRQRQKSLTSEQTKHRRTRSGCYTCRQRRVKCDETRPTCDRCRKGKRDCTYPDKTTSSKAARSTVKSKSPSTSSSSDADEADDSQFPLTTPDEFESLSNASSRPFRADSKRSTILEEYNGAVAEIQSQLDRTATYPPVVSLEQSPDWESYPKDVKFYLEYFRDSINYCHYAFKHDPRDFLKTEFLEQAFQFKPLLYSIVAFTAYHHALRHPDSTTEKFLDYYDQSVTMFRRELAKRNTPAVPVLLTMLQLATIEEFLGDWVNLVNHQRAAAKLMQETMSPTAMTQTFAHIVIIVWYWRFDLFAGVVSGNTLTLGREWFEACVDSCAKAASQNSMEDLGVYFDQFFSKSRLLVTDVTLLFAAESAGKIDRPSFDQRALELWERLQDHARQVENVFRDASNFNNSWQNTSGEETITDYMDPTFMFAGPYFTMNYILVDSWLGRIIFLAKISSLRRQGLYTHTEPKTETGIVQHLVMKVCKMTEAIQHSTSGPAGAVLGLQASLGVISLILPPDRKNIDWARRKLALIEANGYIYPPSYRRGMSDIWSTDVSYWWLPDGEGLTPLIRSMRRFIDDRALSSGTTSDRDADVRDMNGIFRRLKLTFEPQRDLSMADT